MRAGGKRDLSLSLNPVQQVVTLASRAFTLPVDIYLFRNTITVITL
jgi:hypothetical protein